MINSAVMLIFMIASGNEIVIPQTCDSQKVFSINNQLPYSVTSYKTDKKNKKRKHKKYSYLTIGNMTLGSPYPFEVIVTQNEYGYQLELQMIR